MLRETDRFIRFHFPELSIRGAWVHLDDSYRALCTGRNYPAAVSHMLGELASMTTLMAGQLKHPGRLTFQTRDPGPISLLVMDCTDKLGLRGMAQWRPEYLSELQNPKTPCLNRQDGSDESRLVVERAQIEVERAVRVLGEKPLPQCFHCRSGNVQLGHVAVEAAELCVDLGQEQLDGASRDP